MYLLLAIFSIVVGICLFILVNRLTKNGTAVIGIK